jgi:hypothetical protein
MSDRVDIKKDTLVHIVDALLAANACGLQSEVEQIVFEHSLIRAGGLIKLAQRAGMVHVERERGTLCAPESMPLPDCLS